MATQEDDGFPLTIHHEQQSFRLLELPPDLLGLITSENPPSLFLKSTGASATTPANAVLCTDTSTYQIRQVHSSNSVFVLQPSEVVPNTPDGDGVSVSGVSAIARCATTLELTTATISARAFLKNELRVFDGPQAGLQSKDVAGVDTADGRSKSIVYEDTPVSLQEFEDAWIELCAFELESISWVPSSACLSGIWQSIISAVVLKGLNLQESVYIDDLAGLVEEDGFPAALLQAVIDRLHIEKAIPMEGWTTISVDKCVPWVGVTLLASESPPQGIATSVFLQKWRGLLPEAWRYHAALDRLNGMYLQPSKDIIKPLEADSRAGSAHSIMTSGKRPGKWHEKFKTARR